MHDKDNNRSSTANIWSTIAIIFLGRPVVTWLPARLPPKRERVVTIPTGNAMVSFSGLGGLWEI